MRGFERNWGLFFFRVGLDKPDDGLLGYVDDEKPIMEARGTGGWTVGDECAAVCDPGGSVCEHDAVADALVGAYRW